jgi:hypothetical protein
MSATDDIVKMWPILKSEITSLLARLKVALDALNAAHDSGDTDSAKAVATEMGMIHDQLRAALNPPVAEAPVVEPAPVAPVAEPAPVAPVAEAAAVDPATDPSAPTT